MALGARFVKMAPTKGEGGVGSRVSDYFRYFSARHAQRGCCSTPTNEPASEPWPKACARVLGIIHLDRRTNEVEAVSEKPYDEKGHAQTVGTFGPVIGYQLR